MKGQGNIRRRLGCRLAVTSDETGSSLDKHAECGSSNALGAHLALRS